MFTGLIEQKGSVIALFRKGSSMRMTIGVQRVLQDLKIGDSIAVSGVCLTVTEHKADRFSADVMEETVHKTGLAALKTGDAVNLERALLLSDRMDGHIVTGHIDGTGVIEKKAGDDHGLWLTVATTESILKYIVMKGSVAIDGTSLTVAHVDERTFRVCLIPLTLKMTTLADKAPGDVVNIECDIIGKYLEKLLSTSEHAPSSSISEAFLKEHGYTSNENARR